MLETLTAGAGMDQGPARSYLARFLFRGEDVFLWPQDEGYVTALVYTASDGRTYTITYRATDCFGTTAVGSATIAVPRDQADSNEPLNSADSLALSRSRAAGRKEVPG